MRTLTRPPGGVNLIALDTRFQTICSTRCASPRTSRSSSSHNKLSCSSEAALSAAATSTMLRVSGSSARSVMCRRNLPVRMRDRSSRSSMILACPWIARLTTSTIAEPFLESRTSGVRDSSSTLTLIRFSGCLSSCDITARKSPFRSCSPPASASSADADALAPTTAGCSGAGRHSRVSSDAAAATPSGSVISNSSTLSPFRQRNARRSMCGS